MVSRATCWKSTTALLVISPASTTRPVLQSVSAPTRENLSCASSASSTASEIWSATLSGWPSETDSEVNRKLLAIGGPGWVGGPGNAQYNDCPRRQNRRGEVRLNLHSPPWTMRAPQA